MIRPLWRVLSAAGRLLPLLAVALLAVRAPRLLAAGANNLAARSLLAEWDLAREPVELPQCERRLETSSSASLLARALAWDPANARALLNRGRAAWLAGDCDAARASWQQALQAAPGDRMATLWLFWASGADANSLPGGLARRDLARYAYHAGRQALSAESDEAGLAWLQLSMALAPERDAAGSLADYYRRAGQPEQSAGAWHSLAAALPEDQPDHWWALGQAAEIASDWGQAAWAYRQGVDTAGDPFVFWMAYAAALRRLERRAEAEAGYRQAIVVRPRNTLPYLCLGELRSAQDDPQGAVSWYQQARALDPAVNPFYLVGSHYARQDRPEQARPWLEEAVQLEPHNPDANHLLAQTLYKLGDTAGAAAALEQAVAGRPGEQSWQWLVQLGDWRLELGDRPGALAAYRQALDLRPAEGGILRRIEQAEQAGN